MILRILYFSPSTATGRHDSYRAALAFAWHARWAIQECGLKAVVDLQWALPAISSRRQVHALLTGADLLVIASPTYAQGSPWFVRRFLELGAGLQLWGRLGTAFASAGGTHTGGDVTVADTLRSMMGMGMATFTFAQKFVVFGVQQKFLADGVFEPVDVWFLQQLARTAVTHLAGRIDPTQTDACVRRWALNTSYYQAFPSLESLEQELGDLTRRLNRPLNDPLAYEWWSTQLDRNCTPPDARTLPFFDLLPIPGAAGPIME
jgi:NAD(P)H-dependent FMN reductase